MPAALRTGKSCKATVRSGATKSAIRSPKTIRAWTSGAIIPAGRHGAFRRPIAGRPGALLGGWIGYGAGQPASYAYGENIYYEGDQVYYGDQPVQPPRSMPNRPMPSPPAPPATTPESGEWLPLGVFALTQDGQASGVEPTLFMQLAINKQGVIAGTFKNMETDQTQTLEGMADKKSQRVAWCVAGQQRPIMETGSRQSHAGFRPALVHFADGQTQQWLMVRLPGAEAAVRSACLYCQTSLY